VLLFQHPVLVLVFKQKLCLSLAKWLGRLASFFPCLSVAAAYSAPPSVRFVLSSGSRDQLCDPLAVLLRSCVFTVLVYWGLVSLPHALSLGQGQWFVIWLCAVSMLCWFINCFSTLQCCLTLDVAYWLRWWSLWTAVCPISDSGLSPAHCLPFCLSSVCLLDQLLDPPHFSTALRVPGPLCCMSFLVPCLLFSFFFFCMLRVKSAQGATLVYPMGGCGSIACRLFAHLLVCVSQAGLELVSGGVGALLFSQCNVA
jgi:hypothetical protein